jgi:hypothetical protein
MLVYVDLNLHLISNSMRFYLLLIVFLAIVVNSARAQTVATFPQPTVTVTYDFKTKIITGQIPFDKPFTVNVTSINPKKIQLVQAYKVKYELESVTKKVTVKKNGKSTIINKDTLVLRKTLVGGGLPSFTLSNKDTTCGKDNVFLRFPALAPGNDFDILITRSLSDERLKQVLALNKLLYKKGCKCNNIDGKIVVLADDLRDESELQKNRHFTAIRDSAAYVDSLFAPVKPYYDTLVRFGPSTSFVMRRALDKRDIDKLTLALADSTFKNHRLYKLQRVNEDAVFDDILTGKLSVDYDYPVDDDIADAFDFKKRIDNLDESVSYFNDLYNLVIPLAAKEPPTFSCIKTEVETILQALIVNRKVVNDNYDNILAKINKVYPDEAAWIVGSNNVEDLKAKGASIFTLDVGVTDIWVRDNLNRWNAIPKLFLGLNVYLHPQDKNISSRYRTSPQPDSSATHNLESRRSFWDDVSITGGFTLGSMQNKQFDNVTNGLSFTLGPSLRIFRYARISTGVAFVRRLTSNPIASDKKVIAGGYLSLSLDYDLLSTVSKITSLLF